jgi:hypothetical protein
MRQPTSVVVVDGTPFFLAKDQNGLAEWEERWEPDREGDPAKPFRAPILTWHKGMGDSRGARPGAVHWSSNVYLGHEQVMLPGPQVLTITTALTSPIKALVDVGSGASRRLIALGGRYASEINSSLSVATTFDFGSGWDVKQAIEYNGEVVIAMGDGVRWWRRNSSATYEQNNYGSTPPNEYRYADCFGITDDGWLARGRAHYWSKTINSNYFGGTGNWSAENPIGSPNRKILGVFAYNRWDYVLKQDGLYAFDPDIGQMVNELGDMAAYPATEANFFRWFNRLMLCLPSGLHRYVQSSASRNVGLEEVRLTTTLIPNAYPTAGAAYGGWAYVAYYDPDAAKTYITMFRQAEDGDSTTAPFTPVCNIDEFNGRCNAMLMSDITGDPRLYYARGTDVSHVRLSRNGLPRYYRNGTGNVTFRPPDRAPHTRKRLTAIEIMTEGASATNTVTIEHSWDGSTWTADGTVTASGLTELAVSSNQEGYTLWLRITLNNQSATSPVSVTSIICQGHELPGARYVASAAFRLRDYDHEGPVQTRMTAQEQLEFLRARVGSSPVTVVTPYGEQRTLVMSVAAANKIEWPKYHEPQPVFEVLFKEA